LKIILLLFCSFLIFSCRIDDDVTARIIWPQSIKQITVSGKTINLTVVCQIPTPCYDYYNYNETSDNKHYYIKFFAKHDKQNVCPQVISSLDASYQKTVPQPGEYTFHFIRTDSTSLDTMIVIR
jgi:hypothetical protein